MPFKVRKQRCTNSQGNPGSYVVYNADTGKKKSCHGSRAAAAAAARIANAASHDVKDHEGLENYTWKDLMEDTTTIEQDNTR
jgi:hypothetical protein